MSAVGLSLSSRIGAPRTAPSRAGRWAPILVLVVALDLILAYAAFDRGAARTVLGGVLGIELLVLCIVRPWPALVAFAASWGVVHVLLSSGEAEGATTGGSASASQLIGVTLVLGFGIAAVWAHSRRGPRSVPFPLRAFAAFVVLYAIGELLTPLHRAGLSDLSKVMGGAVLAFIGYYLTHNERRLLALTRAVSIAGGVVAVDALIQYTTSSGPALRSAAHLSGPFRASSLLGSANGAAEFLLSCAGFVLLSYTLRRDRRRAHFDLAMLVIVSIGIIVTFTRSDILALLLMLAVWAALWQLRSISPMAVRVRLAVVVLAGTVALVQVIGSTSLLSRLEGRQHTYTQTNVLNGRTAIWSNELHKFESADIGTILIGSGAHTSYTKVYEPEAEKYVEYPPHDLLLWLIVETGLIGLVVYGAALFTLGRSFLKTARRRRFTPSGQVAAVAFAATLAVMLDGLFHNMQVSSDSEWYFMLFVGVALRMAQTSSWPRVQPVGDNTSAAASGGVQGAAS